MGKPVDLPDLVIGSRKPDDLVCLFFTGVLCAVLSTASFAQKPYPIVITGTTTTCPHRLQQPHGGHSGWGALAFARHGSLWCLQIGDTKAHELTDNATDDSSPVWPPIGKMDRLHRRNREHNHPPL